MDTVMDKIVIVVRGGVVQGVHSNIEVDVVIVDHDDIDHPDRDSDAEELAAIKGLTAIY